ncbi:L-lysine 2,3-aminomutase [Neochlamydia sp. EPS4]|nr:L-lysine 2,3-aminomutase [Neochlamydia sp. EPS4]
MFLLGKMQTSPALWRQIQRSNFTNWKQLADFLKLSPEQGERILKNPSFKLNLPLRLAQKITKESLDDPILKQFLPALDEKLEATGFQIDPVQDRLFRKETKLLQKYKGRALLVCTSACAMHCRYCFRQNFEYDSKKTSFANELELIREDLSLREIILSGGDPLSLENRTLSNLLDQLDSISHLRRVRFHTRFPIGIPERIDKEFLDILRVRRVQIWFVVHVNHPRELDEEVLLKLKNVQCLGIPVLNQCVLLKGVNDDKETQKLLCEKLVDHGILPYYMHQLDRVKGTAHFEVEQEQGCEFIRYLTANLSGYAVPKYVQEVPGESSKTPLF